VPFGIFGSSDTRLRFLLKYVPMTGLRAAPAGSSQSSSLLVRAKAKLLAFFLAKKKRPIGLFIFLPMTGLRAAPAGSSQSSSLLVRAKAKLLAFFLAKKKRPIGLFIFLPMTGLEPAPHC
jgi:hypothetical protein